MGPLFLDLNPLWVFNRPLILHVPGVESPRRLEEQYMDLLFSNRAMLDASRHNQKLTLFQTDVTVPELHPESPLDHQE